ncbi:MAG: alpha/beta hydrolase [Saprospiraceae bacterium]|nr:alpha/beta hydrolase [Saprospiraceae bacterium]MCF8248265.1 alpha/beta hydrolase [Saprospiraceae bacterium]MCF8279981.1 alpha/beta hydrolase [Bacteroidales bacterium]MCF8309793.1 alpha/beta hydrolase [Saprospiraceae bacterium]MCF8438876.1 alpha/beta hydrolase [Saprospiraceae bacterium]
MMKILLGIAVSYLALYLLVPQGNFIYEGIRLPFWLLKLRRMEKPKPAPLKIKYGNHFRQYLLHFQPLEDAPDKHHIIIYIHGSGWQHGRPEMFKANAQWLTGQGYNAFFLSHRRIPQCDIRELRVDTGLAIKKVIETCSEKGLAHKKILLCGNSAGGNLAALAMFDQRLLAEVGLSPNIFSALALFAAPLDLRVMWSSPPLLMLTRMKKPAIFDLANPIHYLESEVKIPTLLIHGDKDGISEYQNTVVFEEKLRNLGTQHLQFETLENGMHLDSASWCMPGHPCCEVFGEWLEGI